MAVSTTSVDYTGRTLDMYISGSSNLLVSGATPVSYTFGTNCKYIAGVQKLVQRYVVSLINSGFAEELLNSNHSNIQEASHIFNLYSWDVITTFRDYQTNNPGLPADEQLQTVQLLDTTVSIVKVQSGTKSTGTYVNFSANLLTVAGDTVQFILPLSIL